MDIAAYGRYLFLLQYHLREEHDNKQCLVNGRSQFIIDEQLSYPICTACNEVITPRSIGRRLTEKTMERESRWQLDRRASTGQNNYAVAELARRPQEIQWHHDYDDRGVLVCIDPHYADSRQYQLHSMFELSRPSAQYPTERPPLVTGVTVEDGVLRIETTEGEESVALPGDPEPTEDLHIFARQRTADGSWSDWGPASEVDASVYERSFDPLPENREDALWVISIEVNGVDGDKIDTPLPDRTPVQVCVSDGMMYTVPLGTRMYLSDGSVLSVQATLSGQVKGFIQREEVSNGEEETMGAAQ